MRSHFVTVCAGLLLAGCAGSGSMTPSGSGGGAGSAAATGTGGGSAGRGGSTGGATGTAGAGGNAGNAGSTAGSSAGAGGAAAGTAGTTGGAGAAGSGGAGGKGGASGATGSAGAAGGGAGSPGTGGSSGRGGSGGSAGRGGSAGTGSAGTGGVAGTGGAAANPCASRPGLIFCDSFETATPGSTPSAAPWSTSIIGAGTVTIDGAMSTTGGQRSVHINDVANDYDTLLVLRSSSILPTSSGRFYVRFNVRFGSALSSGHNTFVLADLFAMQGQGHNLRFGEDGGFLEYTLMGDSNSGHATGLTIPPGRWTCIELLIDHVAPEIDVWIDGAEIADMHHTNYPLDNYDNVRFGFEKYAGPAMEAWYDDIAIGTQRIGCQ